MFKYDKEKDEINQRGGNPGSNKWKSIMMSHQLLETLREALGLKQIDKQKYTIKIADGNNNYLNMNRNGGRFEFADRFCTEEWQTCFTQTEIDELKQRGDLAIDWNKVRIEPVENE